jgi:hypothetical protein
MLDVGLLIVQTRALTLHFLLQLQPWERVVANPINSLQQVSMECVEEVMESKPYGIDVSLLALFIAIAHASAMGKFCFRLHTFNIPHVCIFIYVSPVV